MLRTDGQTEGFETTPTDIVGVGNKKEQELSYRQQIGRQLHKH